MNGLDESERREEREGESGGGFLGGELNTSAVFHTAGQKNSRADMCTEVHIHTHICVEVLGNTNQCARTHAPTVNKHSKRHCTCTHTHTHAFKVPNSSPGYLLSDFNIPPPTDGKFCLK